MSQISIIRLIIWSLCLILFFGVLYQYKYIFTPTAKVHNIENSSVITVMPYNFGGSFSLINQHGKRVMSQDICKKIRIVYFGYTYCPDLCPMALSNISQALTLLKKDRDRVATYFITIDPSRDTPSKLKEYASNFHPDIQMLTGSENEIKDVMKAFRVVSQKVDDPHYSDYLLDHSTFIYILNENNGVIDVLPHTTEGEKIMETIAHYLFYTGQ